MKAMKSTMFIKSRFAFRSPIGTGKSQLFAFEQWDDKHVLFEIQYGIADKTDLKSTDVYIVRTALTYFDTIWFSQ
jgi:hypothetical protein